ncbi:MAG TPA: ABC transporter permease, partial [Saprospiraceae bacterium]|nr:ABC transporter permease [Saprospiraceae bacterium]
VIWLPVLLITKVIWLSGLCLASILVFYLTGKMKTKNTGVPVDQFVMGAASVIDSFPGLFIILIILVIIPVRGWVIVMGAIALLRWPAMARYMRAEVFKIKESNYIKAAQSLNLPHMKILSSHIIPFAFRPVMISFIFGVSSAILAESSLSFLGIGLPVEELNWGRLLAQSRNHFESWWLVIFPGCAIFFTLLSLYTIGNAWQKNMEDHVA